MVSVDKKTKIFPAPKNEAAVKKETAPKKKDEGQPKDKSTSDADLSKAEGGEKAADSPSVYSRGEGQKPVSKAYKDIRITGTRFSRKRRRNDNLSNTVTARSCSAARKLFKADVVSGKELPDRAAPLAIRHLRSAATISSNLGPAARQPEP